MGCLNYELMCLIKTITSQKLCINAINEMSFFKALCRSTIWARGLNDKGGEIEVGRVLSKEKLAFSHPNLLH